jgi:hypothetical protein
LPLEIVFSEVAGRKSLFLQALTNRRRVKLTVDKSFNIGNLFAFRINRTETLLFQNKNVEGFENKIKGPKNLARHPP